MSCRGGRRRGRPPKSSYTTPHITNPRSNVIEKPKWLQSREGYSGENTTTGSRASSPGGSINSFTQQYSAKKHISVTPFKKRGRKAGTRGNRGGKAYVPRPSLSVSRRRDGYNYDSDSDSDSDSDGAHSPVEDPELDVESDVDIPMSDPESEEFNNSDSECSVSNQGSIARKTESAYKSAPTPLPFWLQTEQEVPRLELPKSSEDLLLPSHQVLPACAVYEVLRKFSSEVRLSPFRLEDFLGALQSEELTPLLAEVHVQLLKAMLREEDAQQTWFGPLDQKDSTNSMLYFNDSLTWPEVMRVFLQSDPIFSPALALLDSCEYPFTTCDVRLQVLKFLTDHFLSNTAVRQEILSEGNIKYNDHCRVCHKMGDLLCCETCPAVYHLHCLDPPLENVPNEDWQCPICTAQICKGVTDCISDAERSGFLCRQDCLGFDRHGRKYWFIARRVFVEENCDENGEIKADEESRKTWYYSSPFQFEQLLSVLDRAEYERGLCQELYNLRPEILRQMAITVQLTNELKGKNKSYLEVEEETARTAHEAAVKVEKQEEDEETPVDVLKSEDEKTETPEEVVEECGVEADDDFMQQLRAESEEKPKADEAESQSSEESSSAGATYATRTKTGTIVPRTYTDPKRKPSVANGPTVKEEGGRKSKSPLPPDVIFKLGMEGGFKNYVNQYTANPLALNKNQAAEERDRKRHLSHKFSLTGTAEFKWSGSIHGSRTVVLQTVRSTLLQLHSQIPAMFMHPNWSTMRKPWITAVNACVSARDLGHVLCVLVACIRPVVFNGVWHESLGHIRLQRQTLLEREERKKVDKKEKKDKELEEEMHRLHTVHYTKGLKHQIWKHKGEEFRLHGQWGWRWLAATRPVRKMDARNCGLRAGPWRVITCSQEEGKEAEYVQRVPEPGLEIYEIPPEDPAMEVVDVTAAMLDSNRRVYPKIARKGKLDSLLDWRVKLKVAEEKNLLKVETQAKPAIKADEEAEVDVEGDGEVRAKLVSSEAAEARLEQLKKHRALFRCYHSRCDGSACYSPVCRAIAPLEARVAKDKADREKQKAEAKGKRMYSNDSTRGPVFLKRILPEDEARAKKKKVPVKYPMMSRYMTKSKKRTIFVLPDHEVRHMARRHGQALVQGYHHGSKNNSTAWIYPSARPLFKTCWFYRTTGLQSLSAAALQLRILWACLRWEEMLSKSSAVAGGDGKNQTTTDTEIVTTDILKHRHVGRFLERTQYYQRRVVIPLDVPKTVREVTPSRSGLRKRKMVEAPRLSQPIVTEEWVDEERLDLLVIKHYHERQERAAAAASTPASAMTRLKTSGQTPANGKSMEELKAQAEQQLRAQRAAHQQKSATGTPGTPGVVRVAAPGKGAAGKVSVVATPTTPTGTPVTRRILITKDGKTGQIVGTPGAAQPVLLAPSPGAAPASPAGSKLQITRGPDGKIQIRGLQPGQQLVRMADGRLSIISPSPMAAQPAPAQTAVAPVTASDGTALPKTIIVQKAAAPGQKPTSQIIVPAGTNTAAIAQQLASGKLTLGTINGQQVLIPTPAAAVAAKPGETPATPVAPTTAGTAGTPATPTTATAATAVTVATPAVQPKQAVILQTPQGQRIVVQNLQGGALTAQQLAAIQSQVLSRTGLGANNKPVTIAVRAPPATALQATPTVTTTTATTPSSTKATAVTTTPSAAATATASSTPGSPEKGFVVTPDFIQQTIRKALRQENLAPEIEQKLLQLQRFQEKQKTGGGEVESVTAATAVGRKRTTSEVSLTDETEPVAVTPAQKPSARKVARTIEPPTAPAKPVAELSPASKEAAELREQKNRERSLKAQQRNKERRQQAQLARLQGVLSKHSEQLKKEMLRKRALLEKELRVSVQKEISGMRLPSPTRPAEPQPASPVKKEVQPKQEEPAGSPVRSQKRRRASSPDKQVVATPKTPVAKEAPEASPVKTERKKRKRNVSEGGKKKLYCVCRTPYDNTKFYVGCDVCSNWFHGECVGITEAMSQKMTEFVCDGCRKENGAGAPELFCLCRQPYDESQFYICCDKCQDWFHGRCVGVLQSESDSIDEYKCPNCEPKSAFNHANSRALTARDYDELRKLLRQLQAHKSSWPFREPVNAKEVPDYYEVIKDPMDLRKIEGKINERRYQRLLEFIGDVTKIFDNCRYYNAKESNIARCATTLETFFVPRLRSLRASMAS